MVGVNASLRFAGALPAGHRTVTGPWSTLRSMRILQAPDATTVSTSRGQRGAPSGAAVLLLDGGWNDTAAAEQAVVRRWGPFALAWALTHVVGDPHRVLITLTPGGDLTADLLADLVRTVPQGWAVESVTGEVDGPAAGRCRQALRDHRRATAGRAFVYPGSSLLTARLSVAEVLRRTAIAAVELPGGRAADPALTLAAGDHARPTLRGGALVLAVRPGPPGWVVPQEQAHPTAGGLPS